jgi:hypothetical protein
MLNCQFKQQTERRIGFHETCNSQTLLTHLTRLRRIEMWISDAEFIAYGAIFKVFLGLAI